MKQEIERALAPLVGLTLWGPARAANMLSLQAGARRAQAPDVSTRSVGELALHIFCPWRLIAGGRILAGAGDLFTPADPDADLETFDWDAPGATWWDLRVLEAFADDAGPRVTRVSADDVGGFTLECEGGVRLEVFPSSSASPHVDTEFWRLLRPDGERPHFVVETTGIHTDVDA